MNNSTNNSRKKNIENKKDFTHGPILKPLIRFVLPVLAALFLQSLYGAVDLLVVGHFAESKDVSAVSTGSQLMLTLTNMMANFAMGITIILGQKIGCKREDECGGVVGSGICLFFAVGAVITIAVVAGASELAGLLKAPAQAHEATTAYIRICGGGMLVIIAYNLIGSIFRGIGDSKTPLITVAIACVFNIFGDIFLVYNCKMGAAGAAIATVAAQFISVIASLIIIKKKGLPFEFKSSDIKPVGKIMGKISMLGVPLLLSALLVDMSFLIILAIINSLGLDVSSGVGVAEKVCAFIMLVSVAFMQSMAAFVSQNFGAGYYDRAKQALKYGIILSVCCGIVMAYITFFHGDLLCNIFTDKSNLADIGWQYLKAYAIDTILTSFLFCFIGFFNGVGMTKFVMTQGIVGAMAVRVPVSYIMSKRVPVNVFYIGLATPCSTVIQIILCFIAMVYFNKEYYNEAIK